MELNCGNVLVRPNWLEKAGDRIVGHAHNFDHCTVAIAGRIRVSKLEPDAAGDVHQLERGTDPVTGELFERECRYRVVRTWERSIADRLPFVTIYAGVFHLIEALEDNSGFLCVYAHRNPQGEITQHYDGWERAYV